MDSELVKELYDDVTAGHLKAEELYEAGYTAGEVRTIKKWLGIKSPDDKPSLARDALRSLSITRIKKSAKTLREFGLEDKAGALENAYKYIEEISRGDRK